MNKDELKRILREAQQNKCFYCNKPLPEEVELFDIEHCDPLDDDSDIVASCPNCNNRKSILTAEEFKATDLKGVGTQNFSYIRYLIDERKHIQETRKQTANKILAAKRGMDNVNVDALSSLLKEAIKQEKILDKAIIAYLKEISKGEPIVSELFSVKGIGPQYAIELLARVDIKKADTVSALWKYCGYAPGFDKLKKGTPSPFNKVLRSVMYNINSGFLKAKSPYRDLYDKRKAKTLITHPDWTKQHHHLDAMRFMGKIFLSHFYERSRTLAGLPVYNTYAEQHMNHNTRITPEEMGWKLTKI